MKIFYKIFISLSVIFLSLLAASCDTFDDLYVKLSMDTEFHTIGFGPTIDLTNNFCLSDFSDYDDNKDNLEEITYISAAYLTLNATQGLQGDNLQLELYEADGSTLLFSYSISNFDANYYVNNALEIKLTPQEINNMNAYLTNPKENKCFVATLKVSNVRPSNTTYELNSKFEFLTELKVKP
jgi:hypothetical protein